MDDPFEAVAIRERISKAGRWTLFCAAVLAASYLPYSMVVENGRVVKAEVVRVGMFPTGGVAGGNLPIVTVRMPDGSIRAVEATWADVDDCAPGRWINLVRDGTALQVGKPGCQAH